MRPVALVASNSSGVSHVHAEMYANHELTDRRMGSIFPAKNNYNRTLLAHDSFMFSLFSQTDIIRVWKQAAFLDK